MQLNPFENNKNEYELKDILNITSDYFCSYKIKNKYVELFNLHDEYIDYDLFLKIINTKIDWKYLCCGEYQGDYYFASEYDNKIYFVDVAYGSCSGCDALQACASLEDFENLQLTIKRNIREFDNWTDFYNWLYNTIHYFSGSNDEIMDWICNEFNLKVSISVNVTKQGD